MKNKILFQQRLSLIDQLLDVVNSEEEFNYLQQLKLELLNNLPLKGGAQI